MIQLSITVFTYVNICVSVSGSYDRLFGAQIECQHKGIELDSRYYMLI
jgi:hypothetical protein